MKTESLQRYEKALHHLRKIEDAVSRLHDSLYLARWEQRNFSHPQKQLYVTNQACIALIEIINEEIRSEEQACKHNWLGGFCDLCGAVKET